MVNEMRAEVVRKKLRMQIAKQVGPMAMFILDELIKQLPQGNHIEGWFLPDHKGIMREKKLNHSAYYYLVTRLVNDEFIFRGRKMFGARRGIWYKINFDKMEEMIRAL